jgi:RNA polymerase sigma-70 factor, ECF subfamily
MSEEMRVVAAQVIVNQAMAETRAEATDEALEIAVREHGRLVYRVCYSVLRNQHDAEDATQETFLRVWRYRGKLAKVRELRTWLARIAWRVAVERRKKLSEVPLDEAEDAITKIRSSATSADQVLLQVEMQGVLDNLIAALPSKLRDPLTLSTLDEMSPLKIAQVLGMNEAAVRSRLFRARQILRSKLAVLVEGKHGA